MTIIIPDNIFKALIEAVSHFYYLIS